MVRDSESSTDTSRRSADAALLNRLLVHAQSGESAALNELCRSLQVRLRPILQSRLWGWPAADLDDILQNTLLVFVEKLPDIRDNPHYVALSILRNKIGDALRGSRRQTDVSVTATDAREADSNSSTEDQAAILPDPASDFEEQVSSRQMLDLVRAAIVRLPALCRILFTAMLEDRTIKEVWELFQQREPNLSRSAFDKRTFDCRRRLRRIIGERL